MGLSSQWGLSISNGQNEHIHDAHLRCLLIAKHTAFWRTFFERLEVYQLCLSDDGFEAKVCPAHARWHQSCRGCIAGQFLMKLELIPNTFQKVTDLSPYKLEQNMCEFLPYSSSPASTGRPNSDRSWRGNDSNTLPRRNVLWHAHVLCIPCSHYVNCMWRNRWQSRAPQNHSAENQFFFFIWAFSDK